MDKKIIKQKGTASVAPKAVFDFPLRLKYIFLAITALLFYANSIFNKYALDDNLIILKNTYVQMGVKGIPKILTHDSYTSFYSHSAGESSGLLSAGRFRPLSQIVFAMAEQLFGRSAMLPYFLHLVNVLAYMACIIAIFFFLEKFLLKNIPSGSDIAFFATFLFTIHPLHTEIVANIKSLDEILSVFFIMLTFIYSFKYLNNNQIKNLVIGTGSFFFALLSKEYAVTMIFFIPFLFYLLKDKTPLEAIKAAIPYYGILVVYLGLRYNAVGFHSSVMGTSLLSNPYVYATPVQKIATEFFVLGKYLGLLIFPYPLASDYSYNQIPYHSFSDLSVLLSLLIYVGILVWGIVLARKKDMLSFAVFFYLLNILMISNFVLDIGATMGERLVFHSSLGFLIAVSYYLFGTISKISVQTKKKIILGSMSLIGIACFGETVIRNAQWKDDSTLFIHDAGVVPNSFLVNNNAGSGYLLLAEKKDNTSEQTNSYLDSAHKYLLRALYFNPQYTNSYLNLAGVYVQQGMPDSAQYCLDKVQKLHPEYFSLDSNYTLLSKVYLAEGLQLGKNGRLTECIGFMKKALLIDSNNADIWYNLGVAYYRMQLYDSTQYAWLKTLQDKPTINDETNAERGLEALAQRKDR